MSEQGQKPIIVIKRVKKVEGGGHGGSWKVAYADLVTAMMAFFLLMWLLNMVPQQKKEELAAYFNDFSLFSNPGPSAMTVVSGGLGPPGAVVGSQAERPDVAIDRGGKEPTGGKGGEGMDAGEAQAKALQRQVEKQLEKAIPDLAGQVAVIREKNRVRIEIMDKAKKPLFDLGGITPTPEARRILKAVTESIKQDDIRVAIEGHTDAYRYSGAYSNWDLSTGRALATRRMMVQDGLLPEKIAQVTGYAATRPYVADKPYDPRNRRISLLLFRPPKPGEKPAGKDGRTEGPTPTKKPPPTVGEELERQINNLYDKSTEGQF